MSIRFARRTTAALALAAFFSCPSPASAQRARSTLPPDPLGVDVFANVGATWPSAKDSFDALELDVPGIEFGGGVRLTGVWRKLFVQGSVHRWSDTGERAFVSEDGTVFPLGIPLDVKATFVDGTVGWKESMRNDAGRITFLTYAGAGAGIVRYSETSSFSESGDDVEETKPGYHVLAGAEIPLGSMFAVTIDGRYRFIPGLLGDDGVSAAFDEKLFGGFTASVGVRIGFGGPVRVLPPLRSPGTTTPGAPDVAPRPRLDSGVMLEAAPVFLLPDATRTPLRTLNAGTSVRILEEKGEWVRIEFRDAQFGSRVGYVQRKFIQVRQ